MFGSQTGSVEMETRIWVISQVTWWNYGGTLKSGNGYFKGRSATEDIYEC